MDSADWRLRPVTAWSTTQLSNLNQTGVMVAETSTFEVLVEKLTSRTVWSTSSCVHLNASYSSSRMQDGQDKIRSFFESSYQPIPSALVIQKEDSNQAWSDVNPPIAILSAPFLLHKLSQIPEYSEAVAT